MSSKFDVVQHFYERKLWDANRVYDAVVKGWITEEQFKELTEISFENYKRDDAE